MTQLVGLSPIPGMTLQAKAIRILAAVVILGLLLALAYCQGRSDGKAKVELADQKAVTAAVTKQKQIDDNLSQQRVSDAVAQAKVDQSYADAIAKAPGGANSPAAVAYACQQLRRAGYSGAKLPPECGR